MNKRTAEALEASIAHWKRMRDAKRPFDNEEEPYSDDCPLCALFLKKKCKGCPVAIKTDETMCRGTAWVEASNAWEELRYREIANYPTTVARRQWRLAANKMIKFLESLR